VKGGIRKKLVEEKHGYKKNKYRNKDIDDVVEGSKVLNL
jgi:hypothetical protein